MKSDLNRRLMNMIVGEVLPIHCTVHDLFKDSNISVFVSKFWGSFYALDTFAEKAICNRQNVRFVNNGDLLKNQLMTKRISCILQVLRTFLGLPNAKSKAAFPILVLARSVIKRVARASFPSGVRLNSSCLTYCGLYEPVVF